MSTDPGSQSPFTDPTGSAGDDQHPDATAPLSSPWGASPGGVSPTTPMPAQEPPTPPSASGPFDTPASPPYSPVSPAPPAPPAPAPYPGQYGQPGQAYPPYGAPAAPAPPASAYNPYAPYGGMIAGAEHPQGTLILVLGIVSIVLCQLTGPVAWIMGRKALREIDASRQPTTNRGQVMAGMICGIIGTVFLVIAVLYVVFALVVFAGAAGTSVR